MTAGALLRDAAARLAAAGVDSARLDAELLLAHALGLSRSTLLARLREPVAATAAVAFTGLIARRARREPLAYLTGVQEFWSLPFAVTPDVLIPRPETELLAELAIAAGETAHGGTATRRVLDLGTGSGCLAVAIARELPAAQVTAVDTSAAALAVARRNAMAHGVAGRITFVAGDLYAPLAPAARFDCIVSNPPYLAPADAASPELAYEPHEALYTGADGLAVIRRLLADAPARLVPGGRLLVEIGATQGDTVLALARAAGLTDTRIATDLAGRPRVLVATRQPGSAS